MNDNLNKLIEDGLRGLPEDMQKAISSTPWIQTLNEIGRVHLLDKDKLGTLVGEVATVILRYEPAEKFNENLINNVGLDIATAENIINEITEKIFIPIDLKINNKIQTQQSTLETESVSSNTNSSTEKPTLAETPNYSSYESGKDPYREPIE